MLKPPTQVITYHPIMSKKNASSPPYEKTPLLNRAQQGKPWQCSQLPPMLRASSSPHGDESGCGEEARQTRRLGFRPTQPKKKNTYHRRAMSQFAKVVKPNYCRGGGSLRPMCWRFSWCTEQGFHRFLGVRTAVVISDTQHSHLSMGTKKKTSRALSVQHVLLSLQPVAVLEDCLWYKVLPIVLLSNGNDRYLVTTG